MTDLYMNKYLYVYMYIIICVYKKKENRLSRTFLTCMNRGSWTNDCDLFVFKFLTLEKPLYRLRYDRLLYFLFETCRTSPSFIPSRFSYFGFDCFLVLLYPRSTFSRVTCFDLVRLVVVFHDNLILSVIF